MAPKKGKGRGEKTVAILDIESGSVGAGLARISRGDAPKLFGEVRVSVPILNTRNADALAREVEKAISEALSNISGVAARVRGHQHVASQGEIDRVAVFVSPPWAAMHLSGGTAEYAEPIRRAAAGYIASMLGSVPVTFHPFGTAAAHGTTLIFAPDESVVLCVMHGETSELLNLANRALVGRSTVPVGTHTLLRTLVSHGGVSAHEARSYLKLKNGERHALYEPFVAAQRDMASLVADSVRDLREGSQPGGIIVLAPEPTGDLFARSLAEHNALVDLFPNGGTVRALKAMHAMPYIAAHAPKPDMPLMLESLFIDAKFSGI
jgi:hypothetical protein